MGTPFKCIVNDGIWDWNPCSLPPVALGQNSRRGTSLAPGPPRTVREHEGLEVPPPIKSQRAKRTKAIYYNLIFALSGRLRNPSYISLVLWEIQNTLVSWEHHLTWHVTTSIDHCGFLLSLFSFFFFNSAVSIPAAICSLHLQPALRSSSPSEHTCARPRINPRPCRQGHLALLRWQMHL